MPAAATAAIAATPTTAMPVAMGYVDADAHVPRISRAIAVIAISRVRPRTTIIITRLRDHAGTHSHDHDNERYF
jgi:hypothetical protein